MKPNGRSVKELQQGRTTLQSAAAAASVTKELEQKTPFKTRSNRGSSTLSCTRRRQAWRRSRAEFSMAKTEEIRKTHANEWSFPVSRQHLATSPTKSSRESKLDLRQARASPARPQRQQKSNVGVRRRPLQQSVSRHELGKGQTYHVAMDVRDLATVNADGARGRSLGQLSATASLRQASPP